MSREVACAVKSTEPHSWVDLQEGSMMHGVYMGPNGTARTSQPYLHLPRPPIYGVEE